MPSTPTQSRPGFARAQQDAQGNWFMSAGIPATNLAEPPATQAQSLEATGGPDDYGYVWNDGAAYNWIDAVSGGTDTGFSGSGFGLKKQVALPFNFKYYENTYSQVYIAASGYLMFSEDYATSQPAVPSPEDPNDIIVPFGSVFNFQPSGDKGQVYYKSGGSAPNRYFVAQWNDVIGDNSFGADDHFTFQVVIYETGNILFQYQSMALGEDNSYYCANIGIEDNEGLDGLSYDSNFCIPSAIQSGTTKAILFTRPAPSARVKLNVRAQGAFVRPNEVLSFTVPIWNIGELGTDTFDVTSASGWPVALFRADGATPLADTDNDGTPDMGALPPLGQTTLVAKITVPGNVVQGNHNTANLTVRSSLNTGKFKVANLQGSVPAPFAQMVDDDNAMRAPTLLLQRQEGHTELDFESLYPYDPVIVELTNGNYWLAWQQSRETAPGSGKYANQIYYAIANRFGEVVKPTTLLLDLAGEVTGDIAGAYLYGLSAMVAPDGRVGLAWNQYKYIREGNNNLYSYNIAFTVIDTAGSLVVNPILLTNFTSFAKFDTLNAIQTNSPSIAVTGNNRFVVAWSQGYYATPAGTCTRFCYVADVYAAVRSTTGSVVTPATKLTNDNVPGDGDNFTQPFATTLAGNRALVTYLRNGDVYLMALSDTGAIASGPTQVVNDTYNNYDFAARARQLPNGNVVVAWTGGSNPFYQTRYAIFNANLGVVRGVTALPNPNAQTSIGYVSVASDASSNIILTAMDYIYSNRRYLYYTLLDSGGTIITPPSIFRTATSNLLFYNRPYISSSFDGLGNATYSSPIPNTDASVKVQANLVGGAPGGAAPISVALKNYGLSATANGTLTATLGSGLAYLSDTSGVSPTLTNSVATAPEAGQVLVWQMPTMAFLESKSFTLKVNVPPSATLGVQLGVQLAFSVNGAEGDAANNTANLKVMVSKQVFLPMALR